MWLLFSLLCMIAMTAADIIGKKAVDSDELASVKLRIMGMTVSFVLGMLMHFLHFGESGLAPWALIAAHPVMLIIVCCTVLSEFLYIFSFKYVGMTIEETVSSLEGIIIFAGIVAVNMVCGRFSAVKDMLVPARLIFILIILICSVLLPNTELLANRKAVTDEELRKEKSHMIAGIMTALLAVIFGCGDSLITDMLLDARVIGAVDITMTAYFFQIFLLPVFSVILVRKSSLKTTSCKVINRYSVIYAVLYVSNVFFGVAAVADDAVRAEIMFLTYPVISILGAKTVLKEKYTVMQNVCIWVIVVAAIGFCVIDYLV